MRYLVYILLITIVAVFAISLHKSHPLLPLIKNTEKPQCWLYSIRYEVIKKFVKKYNLEVSALGVNMPGGAVHKIGMSFRRYQVTSKAKARQIIVECVQDFLEKINSCAELQPYLYDHPFTVKNIDVRVIMFNPDGSSIFYPNIETVNTRGDKIIYETIKPERPYNPIEEEESFEEALELVKTEIPPEDLS